MSRVKFAVVLAAAAFVCLFGPTLADSANPEWKDEKQDWPDDKHDWKEENPDWKANKGDWREGHGDWKSDKGDWKVSKGDWKEGHGDWKDDKGDWKDKHDWKDDRHDWKDDKHDWKEEKHDWKDDKHDWKEDKSGGKSGEWDGSIQHTEFLVCKYCGEYSTLVNQMMLGCFNFIKTYGTTDLDTSLCYTLHIVYVFMQILDKLLEQNLHAITDGLTRLLKEVVAHPKLSKVLTKTGLNCVAIFRCAMTHLHKNFIF